MKLDTDYLTYITKEELRVLVAVELGMRNHEYVPVNLIQKVSKLKRANAYKIIKMLLKNKLVNKVSHKYEGYRLTYLGYDYLALYTFMQRGKIARIASKIGVGKESDIYKCIDNEGNTIVLKLARLGRISFRTVKKNRDYLQHRNNYNWLYLSRLASIKEFAFMEVLHKNGFPTPTPIDSNRHAILMSLIEGDTLINVREIDKPGHIVDQLFNLIVKFAENSLIHSDFNEFNIMISNTGKITVIDFPQMVSVNHINAEYYFNRDVDCIRIYFEKRYKLVMEEYPVLSKIKPIKRLDLEIKASGYYATELKDSAKAFEAVEEWFGKSNEIQEQGGREDGEGQDDNDKLDEEIDDLNLSDVVGEGEEGEDEEEEEKKAEVFDKDDSDDDILKEDLKKMQEDLEAHEILKEFKEPLPKDGETKKEVQFTQDEQNSKDSGNSNPEHENEDPQAEGEILSTKDEKSAPEDSKTKEKKSKRAKAKDPNSSETLDFIKNVMKKKFRPRIVVSKNSNKGKLKKVSADDYFF